MHDDDDEDPLRGLAGGRSGFTDKSTVAVVVVVGDTENVKSKNCRGLPLQYTNMITYLIKVLYKLNVLRT